MDRWRSFLVFVLSRKLQELLSIGTVRRRATVDFFFDVASTCATLSCDDHRRSLMPVFVGRHRFGCPEVCDSMLLY